MRKQVLFLLAIMLNCSVMFGQLTWTNGAGDGQYNNDDNWDEGYAPDDATDVRINSEVSLDPIYVTEASVGGVLTSGIGDAGGGSIIVEDGGSLIFGDTRWSAVGWTQECTLVVKAGGYFEVGSHLWLGFNATANSHMSVHGTVKVGHMYGQNFTGNETSKSDVTIFNGGILELAQWHGEGASIQGFGGNHVLNVMGGGSIIIVGDKKAILEQHVANGELVAPGGSVVIVHTGAGTEEEPGITTVTSTADPILGVNDFASLDFKMHPNPASDFINIESKTPISNVKIYNTLGQVVLEKAGISRVNIAKLSAGYYILKVKDDAGKIGVSKMIKK